MSSPLRITLEDLNPNAINQTRLNMRPWQPPETLFNSHMQSVGSPLISSPLYHYLPTETSQYNGTLPPQYSNMDTAYDHIQEAILPEGETADSKKTQQPQQSLNAEFEEAYKAISSSPWGARFGALVGSVKKQVQSQNPDTFSRTSLST